jgi:hypothetical protein
MYLSRVKFVRRLIGSCNLQRIYPEGRQRDWKALGFSMMTQLESGLEKIIRETGD